MPGRAGPVAAGILTGPTSATASTESLKRGSAASSQSSVANKVQFQDLATHFRLVQSKHEKARKAGKWLKIRLEEAEELNRVSN